jgi:RNA polymerase sigma-70 factor, ECF subfamily
MRLEAAPLQLQKKLDKSSRLRRHLSDMPDTPKLESLYDLHAQALFAFLLNFTRNETDTRDLLQELFVKLARHPGLLSGVREERAFLIRLAHNLAIDLIRRRGAREKNYEQFAADAATIFAGSANPDEQAFQTALSNALGGLPHDQRAVVHLKLWEGLTFEQIADALDLSPNTAASRYRYGLDKLRERLRPLYEEIK